MVRINILLVCIFCVWPVSPVSTMLFVFVELVCYLKYRKNSNTVCMILTKSRGPVEGLRIIQVN